MPELRVVEGRKSSLYNHFAEYELSSCRATETRLMGVVALKLTWQDREDARSRFYQIIHLDYSEYGIDEYLEFDCLHGSDHYSDLRAEMQASWNHLINVVGGRAISITPSCMLRLLESALKLASDDVDREYDTDENIKFRHHAIQRLGMMRDVLRSRGITSDPCCPSKAVCETSLHGVGQYGSINYFLMRLADRDFEAAVTLTDLSEDELRNSPLASHGVQTLIKNSITKVPAKDNPAASENLRMYNCKLITLSSTGYYLTTLSIWLSGKRASYDASVAGLEFGSEILLSDYEAAIQITQPEFLTLFGIDGNILPSFDLRNINMMSRADPVVCENGMLYTIYNETNSHVEEPEYRIGDDVYGYALLTIQGEFILMSPDMGKISMLDESVMLSVYSPHITVKGRYRLDTPIFHTLCHTIGLSFDDMVDPED